MAQFFRRAFKEDLERSRIIPAIWNFFPWGQPAASVEKAASPLFPFAGRV
jgi:hypothetical protein